MTNAARRDPDRTGYQYQQRSPGPIQPIKPNYGIKVGYLMIVYLIGFIAVVGAFFWGIG